VQVFCVGGGPKPPVGKLIQNATTGILSISYEGETRALCAQKFTDNDARVACEELFGKAEFVSYSQGHACEYETFWLDGVQCSGNEERIQDCAHADWGLSSCKPDSGCV
jgi:hypothetical protein